MRNILVFLLLALVACAPPAATTDVAADEADIRALVQIFGSRLQNVALLAPDAAQQIEDQYSEFVTPELLAGWIADPATAPGRVTSSPWPDRIEVDAIHFISPGLYHLTVRVIEITSTEVDTDKAAVEYEVSITVSMQDGRRQISDYRVTDAGQ